MSSQNLWFSCRFPGCSNGRSIEEHPQLPATGSVEELQRGNRETGKAIDASCWIIPGDTLDYGIAIKGLIRKGE